MGVMFTESFARFARGPWDAWTAALFTANVPLLADTEYTFRGTAYTNAWIPNGQIQFAANSTHMVYSIYQDPIVGFKNRFALNLPSPAYAGYGGGLEFNRTFPVPKTKYILGFLLRFNLEGRTAVSTNRAHAFNFTVRNQVKSTSGGSNGLVYQMPSITTYHLFTISDKNVATTGNMSDNGTNSTLPPTFYINSIRDKNASGKVLAYDADIFCEVEVDTVAQTLRFWIDDTFVGNATWNAAYADLANGFALQCLMGTNAGGAIGSAMLSDMYCIDMLDGVVPNTRLGSSTRVMGEMPDTDVVTGFTRPAGFTSNHDVIDDPIVNPASPSQYLTGDGVGTKDLYKNSASAVTQIAGTVHAVTVRARFANASASTHELAVTTSDGTTEVDNSLGSVAAASGNLMRSVALNKDPSGNAWTLASAANLQYGFKIKS